MANIYTVEIHYEGNVTTLQVAEDQNILQAALDADVDIPHSCLAGVCTTCAGKIISGTVEQPDAMGVSSELQGDGYVLLCSAYPRSDIKLEAGKEEEIYQRQFGQPT